MIDLAAWPALVLTAGLATRLRPLSDVRAKAAMPVAGKPIIARILEWLRASGVRRVVINLHHRPETITRLVGDGSEWDLHIRYSWEGRVMGSAGGPRRALGLLDADRFLVINGDTLTDCDLQRVVQRHQESGARITMAVVPGDVARYGGVLVGADGVVVGFASAARKPAPVDVSSVAAPPAGCFHFIGVQAAESDAFAGVSDDEPTETIRTLYPSLIRETPRAIAAFESAAEFLDVGSAADYYRTVEAVTEREGAPFDRGANCRVAPSARLDRSILWDRVTVPADAQLTNCVVADDVVVPDATRFERCVLVAGSDGLITRPF
jgi:NDP-sugar pyrophosphorylase family protein